MAHDSHDDADALPSCRCGTNRFSRAAVPERDYSLLGALYVFWGGTSIPVRVRFRCVHCGTYFDESRDRTDMRAFII